MMTLSLLLVSCMQACLLFWFATVVFDGCHALLHYGLHSRFRWLRQLGRWHSVHHRFYSAQLKINPAWAKHNLLQHVLVEYSVQSVVILAASGWVQLSVVGLALGLNTLIFLTVCWLRGADPHHVPYKTLPAYRGGWFVTAAYHALHHIYPNQFFSSYIKVIDGVFGTALPLAKRRVVMTGARGALGRHLRIGLEKAGAIVSTCQYGTDYTYDNYTGLTEAFRQADILLLAHGSKIEHAQAANCDSFVAMIELFKAVHPRQLVPIEIWGVGSEIECHPCFGIPTIKVYAASKRNYARYARQYFHDPEIQYRHLVHSAFISPMGPGLMTARFAANATLFMLRRGYKYVPVTYTGFAWLNYLRFLWRV